VRESGGDGISAGFFLLIYYDNNGTLEAGTVMSVSFWGTLLLMFLSPDHFSTKLVCHATGDPEK
jgi:hypothetical protein